MILFLGFKGVKITFAGLHDDTGTMVSRNIIEPRHEKTNILVSDLVRHKPCCAATEDG